MKHTSERNRVAVVGGGLAGLSSACVLAARGYAVTLFEKSDWLGGKAAVLARDGFRFDMGPTILTIPSVLRRVFTEAGRRMDQYLEAAQRFGFSGAVLVADPRGIVLRRGYGPADARRRISPDMMFDMGSITKQFTAAAILLLEEEGRLATTDPLSRFFPEAPVDKRDITLHQLLTHTSGLISDFADDYAQMSRDAAVNAIFAGSPGAVR